MWPSMWYKTSLHTKITKRTNNILLKKTLKKLMTGQFGPMIKQMSLESIR